MKRGLLLILLFLTQLLAWAQKDTGTALQNTPQLSEDSIISLNTLSRKLLDIAPAKAFTLSKQALEAAERRQYRLGMASSMTTLGLYYQDQAKYNTALEHFTAANKIYLELKDTLRIAQNYRHHGGLYMQRTLYPEAEQYYKEALKISKNKGYTSIISKTLKDLGGLAYFTKEYEQALDYFKQSLAFVNKDTDSMSYAALLNNIGVVHKAAGSYKLSLRYLLQAYDILNSNRSQRDLSAVLMNIGEVQQHLGQLDQAEKNFEAALRAAKRVNNIQRMVEAYDYLAKFYAFLEDFDRAYTYKSQYASYKDSLYRHETDLQMAEMAKKLQLERKERAFSQLIQDKELELLNKENKINRLELYRKNNLVLLSLLLLLLVGGGTFIVYKGYNLKRVQNQRLGRQNQEIIQKNLQLEEMNRKLQSSEKALKALNDTKDKFFGILAHDLRSPLVTLRGFVQILHHGHARFEPAEMSRLTGRIEHSLRGLTSLLDNLLQWSTTQTGIIEFAPRKLRLQQLIDENVLLLETTAQVKDITLVKEVTAEQVFADKQMLHLIIRNLVGNAIKFTPRGGTVYIVANESETETTLAIKDTGVGMSAEKLKSLLQLEDNILRTSRGTENEKGSGLGLWLCREFVARHKGTLDIASVEGEGSTFVITLPKAFAAQEHLMA
ncbi:MAG: tetratricopeptide repeat protein [Bacteroidetes bacterium]|nr:tetratricopeptide repeat protein [Bacteroidota bacterium]